MARLPQLDRVFLADGGLETDLIYNRGIDLPCFAAIVLMRSPEGRSALEDYYREYIALALGRGCGLVLETPTWRAGSDWAQPLGLDLEELAALNRAAVAMLHELQAQVGEALCEIVVSGCIGPRGDGYEAGRIMAPGEARDYHLWQARALQAGGADMLSGITMTNLPEAIGLTEAARMLAMPVAISFTVETDGRLPGGETLAEAVSGLDRATGAYPAYFMVNCAHPTHYESAFEPGAAWTRRIGGVRANASRCSHAELDAMTQLDRGDPQELAQAYSSMRERMDWINVLGGCCGTDLTHVRAIAEACVPPLR